MELEYVTNILQNYFSNKSEVCTVYLFGSYAKEAQRAGSDVDIALLFTEDLPPYNAMVKQLEIANDLEKLLDKPVDVVNIKKAEPIFVHQIFSNKRVILDKDINKRVEFEVKHRREYFDMIPFYKQYHFQALKRLEEGST